jgi:hypothetical protein
MDVRHFITDYETHVSGGKPKRLSKRKFEPTLDVQWDQIDFDEGDLGMFPSFSCFSFFLVASLTDQRSRISIFPSPRPLRCTTMSLVWIS